MIKKIKIIGLVSVILISMIGIPSVKHFCDMMDISFSAECESSCNFELKPEAVSDNCCSTETDNTTRIAFVSHDEDCCSVEFILNKIDDQFVVNKTELSGRTSNIEVVINQSAENILSEHTATKFLFRDLSPPTINKPDIYLSNHSFLI
ncbi:MULTISPECIES: hypothetical protein [Ignavibacterium]|uniref:hypothetical protein n=1 Tax=Ignavibacterium TaxID=795750 RepID=UPI0025C4D5B8|nr:MULTISPECIES: hypothetical protein [Ignavibacterium]MBI5661539.1 hypothetical protein [Ignavibacterium album]